MELLKGIDVANAINEKLIKESADMGGRVPKLAIIRVGESPDDMSYAVSYTHLTLPTTSRV